MEHRTNLQARLELANAAMGNRALDRMIADARATKANRDYSRGFAEGIAFIKRCIARGEKIEDVAPSEPRVVPEEADEVDTSDFDRAPLAVFGNGEYRTAIRHDSRNRLSIERLDDINFPTGA